MLNITATAAQATSKTPDTEVFLALIAVLAVAIGSISYFVKTYLDSKPKDNTVTTETLLLRLNSISDGVKRLEQKQLEFDKKGWASGLGKGLDTAPALTETIRSLEHESERNLEAIKEIYHKLEDMTDILNDHVKWEMEQKYKGSSE